jgi:hypothetical protein
MLEAVPTLVRRWFRRWELAFPDGGRRLDVQADYHPLPDFVPRNLFSDLSLPEVRVIVPPATVHHEERLEALPILQALNQLAPGRVTRRFAFERGALSHWMPVDPALPVQQQQISEFAEEHEFVGSFAARCNGSTGGPPVPVFRPWQIRLQQARRTDALPSSNSRLDWETDIETAGEALSVPVPLRTSWRRYIHSVGFYLHRFRGQVSVRRFAQSAYANIRTLADDFPVTVQFVTDDEAPAALGFEIEVDGFYVDLTLPSAEALAAIVLSPELRASSRIAFARDRFLSDERLPDDVNAFQRDWLFQILVSGLTALAASVGEPVSKIAGELLEEARVGPAFKEVMDGLFGALPADVPEEPADPAEEGEQKDGPSADSATASGGASRLQQALGLQFARPEVREALLLAAERLGGAREDELGQWLRETILESLGEALLQACAASAPRHALLESLVVDFEEREHGLARIWITETTVGGAGVLQAFAERFAAEPRLFFSALEAALAPTDLELVGGALTDVARLAVSDGEVEAQMARVRSTQAHVEREVEWRHLSQLLSEKGAVDLSHALGVAINSRLLRAGADRSLDELLVFLQDEWDSLERSLGITLNLREFSYVAAQQPRLAEPVQDFLKASLPPAALSHINLVAAISNLLWPREAEVRQRVLQSYNPYRNARTSDPALVRALLLVQSAPLVDLSDPGFRAKLQSAFEEHGLCQVACGTGDTPLLRRTLVRLVASPVDIGFLQFFPAVERVERAPGRLIVTVALREQT